jgi:hypothetical protein
VALTESESYVYNDAPPGPSIVRASVNEPNARKGEAHDLAWASMAGGVEAVWTCGRGKVDHVCKVLDASPALDVLPGPPPLALVSAPGEYGALSSSDGGVYVAGEIYMPTFGGVLRYTHDAGDDRWEAVPGSFQPAEENGPGSGIPRNTEDKDWGEPAPGDRRVFTTPAAGEMVQFKINAVTKDLQENEMFGPDPAALPILPPGWNGGFQAYPQGGFYGNGIAYVEIGTEKSS